MFVLKILSTFRPKKIRQQQQQQQQLPSPSPQAQASTYPPSQPAFLHKPIFVTSRTGYGSSSLASVPAAPGTNDSYSGGGPQRGYSGTSSSFNNYHPYRR
ncbi:hypothetical protein M0802_015892 [Mischocyttarus mexicanus]|nr:hypothetical protein M0802_015892 [Mischocyttarus mexicanus]